MREKLNFLIEIVIHDYGVKHTVSIACSSLLPKPQYGASIVTNL